MAIICSNYKSHTIPIFTHVHGADSNQIRFASYIFFLSTVLDIHHLCGVYLNAHTLCKLRNNQDDDREQCENSNFSLFALGWRRATATRAHWVFLSHHKQSGAEFGSSTRLIFNQHSVFYLIPQLSLVSAGNELWGQSERPNGMPNIVSLEVMCAKDHMDVHMTFSSSFEGIVSSKGEFIHTKCVKSRRANISIPFVSLYRSAQWSSLHLCATSDWKEAILISHRIFSLWNKTGSEWTVLWKHGKMSACCCFLSPSLVTCWLHDDRPDTIHNAHDDEKKKENIYTRNWDTQQTAMRLNR